MARANTTSETPPIARPGRETMDREPEPRHARRDGGCQKEHGPAIEPLSRDHREHDDEPRGNCEQANSDVYNRVNSQSRHARSDLVGFRPAHPHVSTNCVAFTRPLVEVLLQAQPPLDFLQRDRRHFSARVFRSREPRIRRRDSSKAEVYGRVAAVARPPMLPKAWSTDPNPNAATFTPVSGL